MWLVKFLKKTTTVILYILFITILLFINTKKLQQRPLMIQNKTRMHSSRMRTSRSLTVCCSLLPGGGCLLWGVGLLPGGGVCLVWGVCLVRGGLVPGGGGSGPGGVGLVLGVCLVRGGLVWGGLPGRGGVSQHALRQTSPPVDRILDTRL